ncbi:MAG: tRNA (adenosine(37)-N6)-threonylcarbamoyltransferase complex ATPase subunit type 1 TsaE [Rhodocyclaceae bacterium]
MSAIRPREPKILEAETLDLRLPDEAATRELGAALALLLVPGLRIWLQGEIGSGKTTLVRAALRALGYSGPVRSPTYTLLELYPVSRLDFYHLDLYRFDFPEEYLDAGLEECFGAEGVWLVEWPERAAPYLPPADLTLRLSLDGEGRRARIAAHTALGRTCLEGLARSAAAKRHSIPAGASSSGPDSPD